jgi:hypothetical protein
MAVAAGGLIKQSIHRDTYDPETWDPSSTITFNVQILNAKFFQKLTGKAPPKCPIGAKTYVSAGLPFFNIPEPSSSIAGKFGALQSLSQLSLGMSTNGKNEIDELDDEFFEHIGLELANGEPMREFRTASEIQREVSRANVVSFGSWTDD